MGCAAATGCSLRASVSTQPTPSPSRPAGTPSPAGVPLSSTPAPTTFTPPTRPPRTSTPSTRPPTTPGRPTRTPTTSTPPGSVSTGAAPGSATTSAAATTTRVSSGPAQSPVSRCHTSQVTGHLGAVGDEAGHRDAQLTLVNTGGRTCTLDGYGGIGLQAGSVVLPTHQDRVPSPAPTLVVLTPGASATSALRWSVIPGGSDAGTGRCQPAASTLEVIPPDETDPLPVAWDAGPVCEAGSVDQHPWVHG